MKCPMCGNPATSVRNSRTVEDGCMVRRLRRCAKCGGDFVTHEIVQPLQRRMRSREGRTVTFDRAKLAASVARACEKSMVDGPQQAQIVARAEALLAGHSGPDLFTVVQLAEIVSAELRKADPVAFLRYRSFLGRFRTLEDFERAVRSLKPEPPPPTKGFRGQGRR